jgi:glucosamine--fructose-6-phosphate aminotransferase (isomerizing)
MCGIVGTVAGREASPILMAALARLEYRGYDSAGIATVTDGAIHRRRAPGKLAALASRLAADPLEGTVGIGHTRWATHGGPSEANAHPHQVGRVAVVHNGVIENQKTLRTSLKDRGAAFASETDTEVVVHLCHEALENGAAPLEAVRSTLAQLRGAFALAFLFADAPDRIICARRGSPLAIGVGDDAHFIGSDAIALAPETNRIVYLEEGDVAVVTRAALEVRDASGVPVERPVRLVDAAYANTGKNGYRHYMAKEMAEQPEVAARAALAGHRMGLRSQRCPESVAWETAERLTIIGCGTAYYAGLLARSWFDGIARLPVEVDVASEYRYRRPTMSAHGVTIFVSQSGETADTLAAMRYAKSEGQTTIALVNVETSTMAREADVVAPIHAGPEIGVASTKAFTAQLIALASVAISAALARRQIDREDGARMRASLCGLSEDFRDALAREGAIAPIAAELAEAPDVIFLGRGAMYPLALEAALKLKELTYVPAQGYATGELKHGPIALVEPRRPAVAFAPHDALFEKTLSGLHEVSARGGRVVLVTDEAGARIAGDTVWRTIVMPTVDPLVAPMIYAVSAQMIAYHAALVTGKDVDQPRNLAKSVTVE